MHRSAYGLISAVVVAASAYAGFYFLSRPLMRALGLSEYATGAASLALIGVCLAAVLVGTIAGFFLFPLVLRPFVSPVDFWSWIGSERGLTIPYLDSSLERWAALLYGARAHRRSPSNNRWRGP
jgi:hypothetical protein